MVDERESGGIVIMSGIGVRGIGRENEENDEEKLGDKGGK